MCVGDKLSLVHSVYLHIRKMIRGSFPQHCLQYASYHAPIAIHTSVYSTNVPCVCGCMGDFLWCVWLVMSITNGVNETSPDRWFHHRLPRHMPHHLRTNTHRSRLLLPYLRRRLPRHHRHIHQHRHSYCQYRLPHLHRNRI